MPTVAELYQQALMTPSDIGEHLGTLCRLARECRHVTELGTRAGCSTRAFLHAQPEVLVCYDLVRFPEVNVLEEAAREAGGPRFEFHQADVLQVEIEETDLLFIDTFHVYDQLKLELARHAAKVRKYLVFHDTTMFGELGEQPGYRGLWPAIEEFLQGNPHWHLTARFTHNNGLTVLTRDPDHSGDARPTPVAEAPAGTRATGPGTRGAGGGDGKTGPGTREMGGGDGKMQGLVESGSLPLSDRPVTPSPRRPVSSRPPDTAIVVPVHNAREHVEHCLRSLVATCPGLPLIVVDDASEAETAEWLRHFLREECPGPQEHRHVLLHNERQQLFTRTVNRGLRWADQMRKAAAPLLIDFAAVVNSDCVLRDHWLKALRLGMEDPQVGLVGYCDRADGEEPALRELHEPGYINGHCFLLRMKMLEEIGVLCETDTNGVHSPDLAFSLGQAHYGSDRAFSWRANRAGWKTLDCHGRFCDHAGHGSSPADVTWLSHFDLQPLWPSCDQLDHPAWTDPGPARA